MNNLTTIAVQLSLNPVFIPDKKGKGYTGYFAEFPELIAQGETKEEVEISLFSSLNDIYEYRKNQTLFNRPINAEIETINLVNAAMLTANAY